MAAPPAPIPAPETSPVAAPDDLYPKSPEPDQEVAPAPVRVAASDEPVSAPSMHPTARWDGPLVGREAQLADLRARFDRVVADGSPATVLITGEPGSGRTRLVTEFAASLDAANVLHVGCAPADGGGARWPLAALVEALAGLDPLAPAEPARARLATLFEGRPDGDDVVPHLASMIALEGPSDPDHVRWALRRLIEVTARGRPTIVHVDDADRAGAGFVRLLADVATATRDTPLFVVVTTTRETEGLPAIRLSGLDREAVHALVVQLLGASEEGVGAALAARMSALPARDRAVARDAHRERHPGARERALDAARRPHRACRGRTRRSVRSGSASRRCRRTSLRSSAWPPSPASASRPPPCSRSCPSTPGPVCPATCRTSRRAGTWSRRTTGRSGSGMRSCERRR